MNSARARQRADDLQRRLKQRLEDPEAERQLAPLPPVMTGGALIVPAGLLASSRGADVAASARERSYAERAAVNAVMAAERALGRDPVRMPPGHACYDIGGLLFDAASVSLPWDSWSFLVQRRITRRSYGVEPRAGGPVLAHGRRITPCP